MRVASRLAALMCLAFVAGCRGTTVDCTCALAESDGEEFEEGLAPGEDGTCSSRAEAQPAYLYCFDPNQQEHIVAPELSAMSWLLDSTPAARSWPSRRMP